MPFLAGPYDLQVAVQTPSNYASQTVRRVTLQLGAPPPPVLAAPADGSQTDAPSVTVSGSASRGSQVTILRNGAAVAGPLTVAGGVFSASVPLLPGANVLTARASNSAGTSGDSVASTVTLRSLLTVTLTPSALNEGASGTLKVARNHAVGAVAVALSADLARQLTLPATVTLAAGATEVSVPFTAIHDPAPAADRTVHVTASAPGYLSGSAPVTVQDIDRTNLPDLVVTAVSGTPAQASPGAQIQVTWTVKNQGAGAAAAGSTDRIYFSDDQAIGNDHLAGTFVAPGSAGRRAERRPAGAGDRAADRRRRKVPGRRGEWRTRGFRERLQ